MKTVRLGTDLEQAMEEAAARNGETQSEFIRNAIRDRCQKSVEQRLDALLDEYVGAASSGKMDTANTGKAFAELLNAKKQIATGTSR